MRVPAWQPSWQPSRIAGLLVGGLGLLAAARPAHATANYVYHEQTTNPVGGSCGSYLTTPTPTAAQSYPLAWKIEYQFYTDNSVVYYTTDGSTPAGSYGVASGTTQVLAGTYGCQFSQTGGTVDVANAAIPMLAASTRVKYIVSAWHSPVGAGGPEVFANSGTCTGCTPCETSTCATVFTYQVAPPDAGIPDLGPADSRRADTLGPDALRPDALRIDALLPDTLRADTLGADGLGVDAHRPDASRADAALADQPAADASRGGEASADSAPGDGAPPDVSRPPGQGSPGCGCHVGGHAPVAPTGSLAGLALLVGFLYLGGRRPRG